MSNIIKQSTAFTFRAGPFVDDTDGFTPETLLAITQSDIQISKNGGAFAQTSDASPTTTHDALGYYQCPLTTTDTGTLGTIRVHIFMSGALPVWHDFDVVPANVYDSLIAGSDTLNADVTQWLGTAAAAPTVAGVPEVDVTHWLGTAAATPDTAGVPKVNTEEVAGTTQTAGDIIGAVGAAQADLDIITDADGVILGAAGVDLIWDEANTSGDHNTVNSTGRQLREGAGSTAITTGTCAATGQTTTNVRLAASESAVDDIYRFGLIVFTGGTNAGHHAVITDYQQTNKDCTITPALPGACDNTTDYTISPGSVHAATVAGGYDGGAVFIDTANGAAGTEEFVNGTITNPVDSIADARTIADALNLRIFHLEPGSSVTLAQTFNDFEFEGAGYSLVFGSQDVDGCRFFGGNISGTTGTSAGRIVLRDCRIGGATTFDVVAALLGCQLAADLTLEAAGTYIFDQCFSGIAGTSTPAIDMVAEAGSKNINLRHYSGGIELKNFGATGTHTGSVEGPGGQVVLNANCAGGTLAIRGNFTVTDNAGGAVTLSDDARIDVAQINAECDTALTDYAPAQAGDNMGTVSSVTGNVDGDVSGNVVGSVQTNVDGSVGSVVGHTNQTADHTANIAAIVADLPVKLTKNTAFTNFMFKMVDVTDGFTPETGLTPTCERSLDGAAFAACANAATEVSVGWYKINLDATDLNGDSVVLKFTDATSRATEFLVVTQAT